MTRTIAPLAAVLGAVCAALLPARAALAWGPEGHSAVALIADHLLERGAPAARAKLRAILATDRSGRVPRNDVAGEAIWADVLREKSPEARTATTAWHYARMTPGHPDLAAACFGRPRLPEGYPASRGPQDNCSVDKVQQFATELRNPATSPRERLADVQFLLNLVGDLNDPLNAIDEGDRGGECAALQIPGRPAVRLATYWEERLVREVVGSSAEQGAARIAAAIRPAAARRWEAGTPTDWAREAYTVAKDVIYGFKAAKPAAEERPPAGREAGAACAAVPVWRVGGDYETKALAAVKKQLEKGGVRLARILSFNLR
jgi:nuclease S1